MPCLTSLKHAREPCVSASLELDETRPVRCKRTNGILIFLPSSDLPCFERASLALCSRHTQATQPAWARPSNQLFLGYMFLLTSSTRFRLLPLRVIVFPTTASSSLDLVSSHRHPDPLRIVKPQKVVGSRTME